MNQPNRPVATPVFNDPAAELSLQDYLAILRRRWPILLGSMAACLGLVLVHSWRTPTSYSAEATVLVHTKSSHGLFPRPPGDADSLFRTTATEFEFARSEALIAWIGAIPSGITAGVREASNEQSETLVFRASGTDSDLVAEWAERLATGYVKAREESVAADVAATIAGIDLSMAELTKRRDELLDPIRPIEEALAREVDSDAISRLTTQRLLLLQSISDDLSPVQAELSVLNSDRSQLSVLSNYLADNDETGARLLGADDQAQSTGPFLGRNLALGLVAGLVLGMAAALLVESLRDRINDAGDVERALPGVPILATLPNLDGGVALPLTWPSIESMPSYRVALESLVTSLRFVAQDDQIRSLLISAPTANSGKSTLSLALALTAQHSGMATVLVDGDLHRPDIERYAGVVSGPGLAEVIDGSRSIDEVVVPIPNSGGLEVVGAGMGPDSPADVWRDAVDLGLVEKLKGVSEMVIFDSPPILGVSDGLVIGSAVDGALLVVWVKHTSTSELVEAAKRLRWSGSKLVGCVLVGGDVQSYYGAP